MNPLKQLLSRQEKEFDEKFEEDKNGKNSVGIQYIDAPEIKFKSFFEKKNTELINTIIEMVEGRKKDTRISNGRGSTGGVATACCRECGKQEDCVCEEYNTALEDIKTLLQEAIK